MSDSDKICSAKYSALKASDPTKRILYFLNKEAPVSEAKANSENSSGCWPPILIFPLPFLFLPCPNLPCQSPTSFLHLQNPLTAAPPQAGKGQGWCCCLIQISSPSRQVGLHTSGGHVLLEALPGTFKFCFLVYFFCRPSSKLSSRSSQGV